MSFVIDDDQRISWLDMIFLIVSNSLLVLPNLLFNTAIFVIAGAIVGWILGLTSLGTWIADGMSLIHAYAQSEDLYKIGAMLGFARNFLTSSGKNSNKRWRVGNHDSNWS